MDKVQRAGQTIASRSLLNYRPTATPECGHTRAAEGLLDTGERKKLFAPRQPSAMTRSRNAPRVMSFLKASPTGRLNSGCNGLRRECSRVISAVASDPVSVGQASSVLLLYLSLPCRTNISSSIGVSSRTAILPARHSSSHTAFEFDT